MFSISRALVALSNILKICPNSDAEHIWGQKIKRLQRPVTKRTWGRGCKIAVREPVIANEISTLCLNKNIDYLLGALCLVDENYTASFYVASVKSICVNVQLSENSIGAFGDSLDVS